MAKTRIGRRILSSTTLSLRGAGGQWLRGLREARGMTQRELADQLRLRYTVFISMIETGRSRVPPDHFADWADALGVGHKAFATEIMRYYDPVYYGMLFGAPRVKKLRRVRGEA